MVVVARNEPPPPIEHYHVYFLSYYLFLTCLSCLSFVHLIFLSPFFPSTISSSLPSLRTFTSSSQLPFLFLLRPSQSNSSYAFPSLLHSFLVHTFAFLSLCLIHTRSSFLALLATFISLTHNFTDPPTHLSLTLPSHYSPTRPSFHSLTPSPHHHPSHLPPHHSHSHLSHHSLHPMPLRSSHSS